MSKKKRNITSFEVAEDLVEFWSGVKGTRVGRYPVGGKSEILNKLIRKLKNGEIEI